MSEIDNSNNNESSGNESDFKNSFFAGALLYMFEPEATIKLRL